MEFLLQATLWSMSKSETEKKRLNEKKNLCLMYGGNVISRQVDK